MSSTLKEKAVVGRRITLTYYRDLELPDPPAHPGIITGVSDMGGLWIRLDGTRYTLGASADYRGVTYLDEVVPVPELPMGRFTPVASDVYGFYEYEKEGVLVAPICEDGEHLVIVTADRDEAISAATAYFREIGVDVDYVNFEVIQAECAVFEWQPEDAEPAWTVRFAAEHEDQAVHIHYLPA